jgi:hypothetical protein
MPRTVVANPAQEICMSADTVKTTKAPAKPRKTTTKAAAADGSVEKKPKVAAKAPTKTKVTVPQQRPQPSHEEISRLAEQFWIERGWQDGHAEQDWLRAEQELRGIAS